MAVRNFVSSAFASRDLQGLSDAQLGAIVTVLVLCAHADANVTPQEKEELETALRELPWSNASARSSVRSQTQAASELAATLKDEAARSAEFVRLSETLPNDAVRERVYRMAILINSADGEVNDQERDLLLALAAAFKIDSAKAHNILKTIKVQAGVYE